ncbi:ras GTPase activating [Penicillium digitatum]|uniref:Uncharacterized protein n=3 Tax=Penicillium digitatum TaxID=36651 RepID=K9G6B7_PEND2|nr:hypothetical protein PDIP_88560 [Penicillium digitatum Pd1]EKV04159.1 hypothetical protein PDIP_88560 [Penicillium digitatum Pd1]EKV16482.1 hypothetical protein PDIG_20750 [Penicillium digitatum PHI26]KAG0158402.1 hypothetical protein PDIDSM_5916 [Penicillium digitatum]QQK42111.1 ras GTPase activating [Penicillium digitatum]
MVAITEDFSAPRFAILQDLFSDSISAQQAAGYLASISLADDSDREGGISSLWSLLFKCAYNSPEHHDKLVSVLVQLSKLPNAKASNGDSILLYDMQVWKDLPMLGWQFRDEWNATVPAGPPDSRQNAISRIVNRDKFTAHLMATKEPVFAYSWFALITLRGALETPADRSSGGNLEALIPAAAAWITILGADIYRWNKGSDGNLGKGGPLWKGQHGFSQERWQFWKERFGELAKFEEIGDEARIAAREAERMMGEIEK